MKTKAEIKELVKIAQQIPTENEEELEEFYMNLPLPNEQIDYVCRLDLSSRHERSPESFPDQEISAHRNLFDYYIFLDRGFFDREGRWVNSDVANTMPRQTEAELSDFIDAMSGYARVYRAGYMSGLFFGIDAERRKALTDPKDMEVDVQPQFFTQTIPKLKKCMKSILMKC